MKYSTWEEIDDFHDINEFERFEGWMNERVAAGEASELPVIAPYIGASAFQERWYQHIESEEVWRLVWPDGPFTGIFERVR